VPVQPLDVHNLQPYCLAADISRFETLGLRDSIGNDIDADLFEVVIDGLQCLGQRTHVAGWVKLLRHLPLSTKRQEAEATFRSQFGF
jgi:hypothetical protein